MSDQPGPNPEAVESAESYSVARVHEAVRREAHEPGTGTPAYPVAGLGFVAVVIFLGALYLGNFSGGFRTDVYDERPGAGFAQAGDGAAAQEDPLTKQLKLGKRTFTSYCQSCHQASGLGVAGVYPPLVGSEWVLNDPKIPVLIVFHGLQGPITVKGNTYNNVMAPWGGALNDAEIAAVVTYIRNEWGNKADPVTEETVAALRSQFPRKEAWKAPDLEALKK
jgi:mono/diheme cytochrome c family protein